MTKFKEILRLQQQGLSQRQIAASLRISRNTIKEFFKRLEFSDLSLPMNEHLSDQDIWNSLYGRKTEGSDYRKPDYEWVAKEMRHKGVTLLSLWGAYRLSSKEMNIPAYGYTQFCKRYADYVKSQNITMTIARNPGENTEVDWAGSTLFLQDPITADAVPVYLFAATLSYSGYSYFEGFLTMKSPAWISGNVNSVEYFGGTTAIFTPDNLKTGVVKADWYDPELHQSYLEFAEHYGTAILPARVRKPRDKPNVENNVKIATSWIIAELRHRTFFTLEEMNAAIWERMEYFNSHPFQKKDGSRASLFLAQEKQQLSPLPPLRFEYMERKEATVAPDFHVSYDYCLYSVPYKLLRKKVLVRATVLKVLIYHNGHLVAEHPRGFHKGLRRTNPEHLPEKYQQHASWSGSSFRYRAKAIGVNTYGVIDSVLKASEFEVQSFRTCVGILNLARKYSPRLLDQACSLALEHRRASYRHIKNILASAMLEDTREMPSPHEASSSSFARPKGFYSVLPSQKGAQQ